MPTTASHTYVALPAVNLHRTATGKVSAVCEFCARQTRPVVPVDERYPFALLPRGWSEAPYLPGFVHRDGSTGSCFTCPPCRRRLDAGHTLWARREPRR